MSDKDILDRERNEILEKYEEWTELPMLVLGASWLVLLILDLTRGLGPLLATLSTAIWIAFILDFSLRLILAPGKRSYLRRNWLTALALLVPALRVFRLFRAIRMLRLARAARGVRLIRIASSLKRGMLALGRVFGRHGFGYIMGLTCIVWLVGAAGMYAFEKDVPIEGGIQDYGGALWWTAMVITTMGSEYWPRTPEGRLLCLGLSIYAFAVFGYVAASIATFFISRDAESEKGEIAGAKSIELLRAEIAALRQELRESRRDDRKAS